MKYITRAVDSTKVTVGGVGGGSAHWTRAWVAVMQWGGLILLLAHLTVVSVHGAVGELLERNTSCPGRCRCILKASELLPVPTRPYRTTDCRNRKLKVVPPVPRDTEVLMLRGNSIMSFHEQLPELLELKLVDLSHNTIETLGLHPTFANLSSLRLVNLAYNQIHALMHESFRGLTELRTLQLSHNHIQSIEDHSFDGLLRLERLDLSNNQLLTVSTHWFDALPSLHELLLDDNRLTTLDGAPFYPLDKLAKLSLAENNLRLVGKTAWRGLEGLQHLNLNYNQLTAIPTRSFTIFKRLKQLSMDGNPLRMLGDRAFRDFSVGELKLCFLPELEIVDREAFYHLPDLTELHMHDNPHLAYIDQAAFARTPRLQMLHLHRNRLLALSPSLAASLPALQQVTLAGNPFRCDCNIHWIKLLTQNLEQASNNSGAATPIVVIRFPDLERVQCDTPARQAGRLLQDVPSEEVPTTCAPTAIPFFNDSYQRELGDSITYECRAVGVTQPHIHWILSNGKVVNNTSNFSRVRLQARGSLRIEHLKPLDAGTYTCVATNDNGYDTTSTVLRIHSSNIHILHKGVATNFITVTWNGTDSTISTSDYLILYRRAGSDDDYGRVHLKPFLRAYTITNLLPQTVYEFCIAYEHMGQLVRLHCINIKTKHRLFAMSGIRTVGNMTVVVVLASILSSFVLLCLAVTAFKRYRRRKLYKEPEGADLCQRSSTSGSSVGGASNGTSVEGGRRLGRGKLGHMSQIPLDNLYHPPSTPICTSRTSLIGHSNA